MILVFILIISNFIIMRMISLYKIHFSSFHIKVVIIIILTIVIDMVIILSLLS